VIRTVSAGLTALLLLTGNASAEVVPRRIPADAPGGRITAATASLVQIDGKTLRLAPGARVVNQRNVTVTPNMIVPGVPARYALDARGQVRAIWLVDELDRAGAAPVQSTPATR